MKKCIESGLWVPNSKTDDGDEKEGDEKEEDATYEEVKQEQEEAKKEWSMLMLRFVALANVRTHCIAAPLCVWLVCQPRIIKFLLWNVKMSFKGLSVQWTSVTPAWKINCCLCLGLLFVWTSLKFVFLHLCVYTPVDFSTCFISFSWKTFNTFSGAYTSEQDL